MPAFSFSSYFAIGLADGWKILCQALSFLYNYIVPKGFRHKVRQRFCSLLDTPILKAGKGTKYRELPSAVIIEEIGSV